MILFWLICAGLVAIALAFVLPTLLLRAPVSDDTDKERANVEVYRDQISELDADLANGIVSPEQYRQDRDKIERRLLEDVSTTPHAADRKSKPAAAGRGAAYAVSFGL
ncbi:MAG TPA: c-type cytochrome biogenesis protein CcmI, partial [Pyrinomonadaceae bacterium]|nr:c-type cytochrome biogenesis protein CcmI [Pyrinomonadaceae bacterium]